MFGLQLNKYDEFSREVVTRGSKTQIKVGKKLNT